MDTTVDSRPMKFSISVGLVTSLLVAGRCSLVAMPMGSIHSCPLSALHSCREVPWNPSTSPSALSTDAPSTMEMQLRGGSSGVSGLNILLSVWRRVSCGPRFGSPDLCSSPPATLDASRSSLFRDLPACGVAWRVAWRGVAWCVVTCRDAWRGTMHGVLQA